MFFLATLNFLLWVFHKPQGASHQLSYTAFDHGGRNFSPALLAAVAFHFVSKCDVNGVASRQILLICLITCIYTKKLKIKIKNFQRFCVCDNFNILRLFRACRFEILFRECLRWILVSFRGECFQFRGSRGDRDCWTFAFQCSVENQKYKLRGKTSETSKPLHYSATQSN